jgi:hypothetical protein
LRATTASARPPGPPGTGGSASRNEDTARQHKSKIRGMALIIFFALTVLAITAFM